MLYSKHYPLIAFCIGLFDGLLTKFLIGWIFSNINSTVLAAISISVGLCSFIMAARALERMKNKKS